MNALTAETETFEVILRGYPVLDAYDDGKFTRVWCDYCVKHHLHGTGGTGHRVAHCMSPGSPYDRSGYILKVVGTTPPPIDRETLKTLRREARRRRRSRL